MKWIWVGAFAAVLAACGESEQDSYLKEALSGSVKDPSSLQFQTIAQTDSLICGEFRNKKSNSSDQSFTVFVFDRTNNVLRTEGEQEPDEYTAFYNDLRSRCSNGRQLLKELHSHAPASGG